MLQSRIFSFLSLIPHARRKNSWYRRSFFECIAVAAAAAIVMFCSFFDRAVIVDSFSMNYVLDCVLWLECVMV